jgi:hypothetical protein
VLDTLVRATIEHPKSQTRLPPAVRDRIANQLQQIGDRSSK